MEAAALLKYIKDPHLLDKTNVQDLQQLVNDFPYFQSAHLLLSLASRKWDATVYQQSLRKTAIVATNRAHLFKLIQDIEKQPKAPAAQETKVEEPAKEEITPEATNVEIEILKATENQTEPETPAAQALEQEIEKQVVTAFVEKEILKTHEAQQPVVQKREEPTDFGDWLTFLKRKNEGAEPVKEETAKEKEGTNNEVQARKKKNQALIDQIIEKNPGLIRTRSEQKFFTPETKAKESLLNNEHLVTETLARIYALQGNVNKAVRAYEILSLKFPQKSAYFASLIQKLKNNS